MCEVADVAMAPRLSFLLIFLSGKRAWLLQAQWPGPRTPPPHTPEWTQLGPKSQDSLPRHTWMGVISLMTSGWGAGQVAAEGDLMSSIGSETLSEMTCNETSFSLG